MLWSSTKHIGTKNSFQSLKSKRRDISSVYKVTSQRIIYTNIWILANSFKMNSQLQLDNHNRLIVRNHLPPIIKLHNKLTVVRRYQFRYEVIKVLYLISYDIERVSHKLVQEVKQSFFYITTAFQICQKLFYIKVKKYFVLPFKRKRRM